MLLFVAPWRFAAFRQRYDIVQCRKSETHGVGAVCRLLDDNRELYVPELGDVVKPHPHFMLFATQNPAGAYGGRKVPTSCAVLEYQAGKTLAQIIGERYTLHTCL